MRAPTEPVNLSVEEVAVLAKSFSTMRHDVNNQLALIMAAAELLRAKPQMADRLAQTLSEQPPKISAALNKYCDDFQTAFGVTLR